MTKPLIIISRIEAKPDKVECLQEALKKLVAPTLQEGGCLQYDLHQDNNQPAIFIFYEVWENRELWQKHINNDHIQSFLKNSAEMVADSSLYEMSKVL